jgi:hypothetical protein
MVMVIIRCNALIGIATVGIHVVMVLTITVMGADVIQIGITGILIVEIHNCSHRELSRGS